MGGTIVEVAIVAGCVTIVGVVGVEDMVVAAVTIEIVDVDVTIDVTHGFVGEDGLWRSWL